MQPEIEVKFLNINHDSIRKKLKEIEATCEHSMQLMRRTMLDYPDKRLQSDNWGRLRVRDEGSKVTTAYKSGGDNEYSQEIETTVGSYEKTVQLFEAIGLQSYSIQESKRETWHYNGVEIVLDEWPWLEQYIEVEGPDEESVKSVVKLLNLDWDQARLGNVDVAYRAQYANMKDSETISSMSELRFGEEMPEWLKDRL